MNMLKYLNDFFAATTIHGFSYISHEQTRSTRIIWTAIVLVASGGASFLLYQTVDGFSENFVSTTIQTRGVRNFPFPAVTFYPGDYNSEHGFKRVFLNQFDFTRYEDKNTLRDDQNFIDTYFRLVGKSNEIL